MSVGASEGEEWRTRVQRAFRLNAARIPPACSNSHGILRACGKREVPFVGGQIVLALSMFADKADVSDGGDVNKQDAAGLEMPGEQLSRGAGQI